MGEAIGAVLGYAVGIAASPLPIAAVILMLFTERARSNSVSFLSGWALGIATVTTIVVLVPGLESDRGEPSDLTGWIKIGLGALLAFVALRQWRSRPGPEEEAEVPPWMERIDTLKPATAFGLGFLLSAINPKNLVLAAAAGATIGSLELSTAETTASVIVFTLLASLTVAIPVIGYLIAGHRLDDPLQRSKDWLIRNNGPVMAVIFVVFSIILIGDGIEILSA